MILPSSEYEPPTAETVLVYQEGRNARTRLEELDSNPYSIAANKYWWNVGWNEKDAELAVERAKGIQL